VGVVIDYGLEAGGPFRAGARDFSLLHSVPTGSGAHPAYSLLSTGAHSPGVKRPGREADHSPACSAEVKNGGAIPPLSHTSSWGGA
jgi:hypothetical protein